MLSLLFAAAIGMLLLFSLIHEYYRVFPLFTGFLGLMFWQSVSIALADQSDLQWWMRTWAPTEVPTMAMWALVTGEAIWLRTKGVEPVARFWLRFGVILMPFSIVMYFERIRPGNWYEQFIQWREWVWVWLALSAFVGWLFFFWRAERCPLPVRSHMTILGVMLFAHALTAPQMHGASFRGWYGWQMAYRLVAILCCAAWIRNIARLSVGIFDVPRRRDPASSRVASHPPVVPAAQSRLRFADFAPRAEPRYPQAERASQE